MMYWSPPAVWRNGKVALIGGGPSLTAADVESIRASGWRTIAINNSYLLAPWADVLYFCDARWWDWHRTRKEFKAFKGVKVCFDCPEVFTADKSIHVVQNAGMTGLSSSAYGLCAGSNSGYQCIDLATKFGAKTIALFGYDMQEVDGKSHWHDDHQVPTPSSAYAEVMLPKFDSLLSPLAKLGVSVFNCTPNSALHTFPYSCFKHLL